MSRDDIFDGLDDVPWASLVDAYGAATAVPTNLRNVVAHDPTTRASALAELFGSIVHQGTVYASTAPAVPFLIRMLDVLDSKDRGQIVCLLAQIAWGRSDVDAHDVGQKPLTPALEARLATELEWVRSAREAVGEAVPRFVELLRDADANARQFAAQALGRYGDVAPLVLTELVSAFDDETNVEVRAAIVEALCESSSTGDPAVRAFLRRRVSGDNHMHRVLAAHALLHAGDASAEVLDAIVAGLVDAPDCPFDANETLGRVATEVCDALVDRLIAALPKTSSDVGRVDVACALLWLAFGARLGGPPADPRQPLVFGARTPHGWMPRNPAKSKLSRGWKVAFVHRWTNPTKFQLAIVHQAINTPAPMRAIELTPRQRATATAIAEDDGFWSNQSDVLAVYGLPAERAALREWLRNSSSIH